MAWVVNDRKGSRYGYYCSACELETNNLSSICPDCGQFQGERGVLGSNYTIINRETGQIRYC